jgi:hypothetical protein
MPANTPNRGYTYATTDDANDVPLVSQRLAEQVDSDVNNIITTRDAQVPAGRIVRTASLSIPNASWTEVTAWSSEPYRRGGLTYSGGKYVITRPGIYLFSCMANWAGSSAGRRGVSPIVNTTAPTSTGDQDVHISGTTGGVNSTVAAPLLLAAGDQVTLGVYQDSGAALGLTTCQMTLTWIGY